MDNSNKKENKKKNKKQNQKQSNNKNDISEEDNQNNINSPKKSFQLGQNFDILNTAVELKILLLGNGSVGKTSLINRYLRNVYNPVYLTTIGIDKSVKFLLINNKQIQLSIWDTAGQEQFRTITKSFYNKTDGVILCFDLTEKESLGSINYWIEQLNSKINLKDIGIVLVGTKLDLSEFEDSFNEIKSEAEKVADSYQIKYFNTSSLTGVNVKEVFNYLIKMTLNIKNFKEFENDEKDENGNIIYNIVEIDKNESEKINKKSLNISKKGNLKSNEVVKKKSFC
jgi:small GTP-binding protein